MELLNLMKIPWRKIHLRGNTFNLFRVRFKKHWEDSLPRHCPASDVSRHCAEQQFIEMS